mmetsp:Transcript_16957/g.49146  ORF Transcript_16957/g.49146 Transcript_16957/m.49146 type:complete len:130 (+) Transcript_16957:111-500(+)
MFVGLRLARGPPHLPRLVRFASSEPHRVLGLSPGADRQAIKQAYYALAKQTHPDAVGHNSTSEEDRPSAAAFLAVQDAFDQLMRDLPARDKGSGKPSPRSSAPSSSWSGARPQGSWKPPPGTAVAARRR